LDIPSNKPGYPMDYPVPNFGMDHDIIGTEASIKQAEGSVDHTWKLKKDADGNYIDIPTATAAQAGKRSLQALAMREKNDDPTCSSDDGYPSAKGYCKKTIAARKGPSYFVNNNNENIAPVDPN
jgi:hypothetical protein